MAEIIKAIILGGNNYWQIYRAGFYQNCNLNAVDLFYSLRI